ncbi:MAG: hypothetical protein RIC55_08095 [Pirellulaceae bacterium]
MSDRHSQLGSVNSSPLLEALFGEPPQGLSAEEVAAKIASSPPIAQIRERYRQTAYSHCNHIIAAAAMEWSRACNAQDVRRADVAGNELRTYCSALESALQYIDSHNFDDEWSKRWADEVQQFFSASDGAAAETEQTSVSSPFRPHPDDLRRCISLDVHIKVAKLARDSVKRGGRIPKYEKPYDLIQKLRDDGVVGDAEIAKELNKRFKGRNNPNDKGRPYPDFTPRLVQRIRSEYGQRRMTATTPEIQCRQSGNSSGNPSSAE